MQTLMLPAESSNSMELAVELLRDGEVVAFPTDTVYGLGTNAFYSPGIIKLFEAKGRDANKAIAILIGSMEQFPLVADGLSDQALKLVERFWPGGLTLIVPRKKNLSELLSPNDTIGIRIPNHPLALELMNRFGPIATTSANVSGGISPQTAEEVKAQLNGKIPLIIDGGKCPGGIPSTIVDCTTREVQILRFGAISEEAIKAALA